MRGRDPVARDAREGGLPHCSLKSYRVGMQESKPPRAPREWAVLTVPVPPRERAIAALLLVALCCATFWVAFRDPRSYGLGVLCPSRRLLGIYCPGCGTTRAVHDLAQGDFARAWANNPLALLVGIPIGIWLLACLIRGAFAGQTWRIRAPRWLGLGAAAVLAIYAMLRNVPSPAFDVLRPPPYAHPGAHEPAGASGRSPEHPSDAGQHVPANPTIEGRGTTGTDREHLDLDQTQPQPGVESRGDSAQRAREERDD